MELNICDSLLFLLNQIAMTYFVSLLSYLCIKIK